MERRIDRCDPEPAGCGHGDGWRFFEIMLMTQPSSSGPPPKKMPASYSSSHFMSLKSQLQPESSRSRFCAPGIPSQPRMPSNVPHTWRQLTRPVMMCVKAKGTGQLLVLPTAPARQLARTPS